MNKFCFLGTLVLSVLLGNVSVAQDFSNKGKDFWVGYGYHQVMTSGNGQDMVLYFATDQVTNITISIPGTGYTQNLTSPAGNNIVTSAIIPKAGLQDARLMTEGVQNKGIHITSDRAMVAYAHIYNASVSGSCLLFPTNTLGKEYYSINYKNISNTNNANSWFYVVAVDTGTTTVEITPSANTVGGWIGGNTYSVTLTQGQIYNVMGALKGTSPTCGASTFLGEDLTGSKIRSVSTGGSCKPIGVFSGSGRISITSTDCQSSSDNYMVQAFPKSAWGKKYLTTPTAGATGNMGRNFFRICVADPTTVVRVNGIVATGLINNFYYEIGPLGSPNLIEADKPITVAQYITSQNQFTNGTPGDPEVIYLSPVEQNISKVIFNSNILLAGTNPPHQHNVSVVIPNGGTALSSFRIDGAPPAVPFTVHPQDPNYSYIKISGLAQGQHIMQSDSGFNAIAYGFATAESYGYNAGTNVKDLFQFISLQNQYATVNFPATCKGTPFFFSMTFPYQPTQIQWLFGTALNAMGITDVTINNPVFDSTWTVSGKQLYRYKLTTPYTITAAGTYPIRVVATNPTPDGCSGIQEIDFDVQVFDPPVANFNFTTNGCVTSPVQFSDNSNGNGRTINNWFWDFGDGNSNSSVNNPTHTYAAAGSYTVRYAIRTDVGCISDTASQVVNMNDLPLAKFGFTAPLCAGKPVTFSDTSTVTGTATLVKWTWDFGDGPPVVASTNANQVHSYTNPGVYTVTLQVETNSGCASTVFSRQVTISPNPVAGFNLPAICMPSGAAQFNDQSTVSAGNITAWNWNFGDGNTASTQNPLHIYSSTGPFNVSLTVTSNTGCTDTRTQVLNTVFAEPQAAFSAAAEVCLGSAVSFSDQSSVAGSTVTQWNWNFGDGNTSTLQNPSHTYTAAGTYTVTLSVQSAQGCPSVNNIATRTIVVNPLPTISFTGSSPACQNSAVLFTSTSIPNAGVFTQYNWTVNGSAQGGNSATLNYIPAAAGNYTVQLTAVTDKGCSNAQSTTVTVHPKPVASFDLPVICMPAGTGNFSSSSTISSGTLTGFAWNFGDGNTANTANASHTYAGTGPYNVTLTVTSGEGCTDDSTRVMNTIYAEPQAAFTAPAEVCLGAPASFSDISSAAGSTVTEWTWNFGDGNSSTQQNPAHTYAVAGTYTVTLTIRSAAGCASVNNIATRTLVVNPLPTADFAASLPACVSRNISFTDASASNAGTLTKWSWSFGDGNNAVLTNPGPVSHTYSNTGTFNVTLQVENSKGCVSAIITKPVTIHVLPRAGFIPPEACLGDVQAAFLDTSSVSPGTITGWQWNFGDPNANAGNPNTSTSQNPTHQYTAAGSYTATLVAVSDQGCTDTTRRTFFVNGAAPQANFIVQNTGPLCSNRDISIKDASTVDVGSLVKLEIFWDYTNDPTIKLVDDDPLPGELYTHQYPEFGSPATRTVTIRYVAYSGATCLNTFTQTITLLATPTLQFDNVPAVCQDAAAFQVNQAQLVNALPGTGVFSGPGINTAGLFNPSAAGAGTHTITYTYTGTNGCVNSTSNTIEVNPRPGINAGPDKVVLQGGSVVLTPSLNQGMSVTYLWTPPTGLSNPTVANPSASPADDITYTLTVTSDKNCVASDQVFVKVLKSPVIPNIFSPNGDNVHDRWEIPYLESYPGCTIDIYNRYGQLVYHSVGYSRPWDGKVNGKDVPVGTYYYVIDPKNGRQKMAGYVDVIR